MEDDLFEDSAEGKLIWTAKGRTETDDGNSVAMSDPASKRRPIRSLGRTDSVIAGNMDGSATWSLK